MTISNTDLPSIETWTLSIEDNLPHPRRCTGSEAGGITLPLAMEPLPQKYCRKTKQKDDLEMEIGRAIWFYLAVYQRTFYINKDIRSLILPFINFAISHSRFYGHLLSCQKSFAIAHELFIHSCSLISFIYHCSYQYKFCVLALPELPLKLYFMTGATFLMLI